MQGYWLVLDELNLAPTDVLEALNRLLDDNRELVIPETQAWVAPFWRQMEQPQYCGDGRCCRLPDAARANTAQATNTYPFPIGACPASNDPYHAFFFF